MKKFEFINGGKELLDLVEPLWNKLNKHHESNSNNFSDKYKNNSFKLRISKFIENRNIKVNVDLIKDQENNKYTGYCISSLSEDLLGEIDSLFIENDYRGCDLGDELMNRAIEWLNKNCAKSKTIVVIDGNENVLNFYRRYGFYRSKIILEEK